MPNSASSDRAARMLGYIARIHRISIVEQSPVRALNLVLEAMLDLTESAFGFVGEVLYDDSGAPYLKSYAVTNIGWKEEIRVMYEKYIKEGMEFRNTSTLFGHVLKTGETLITNDAAVHPAAGGTPSGHPPLETFAGVAIHLGDQFVGMCGLANRAGGYDNALIDSLKPVLDAAGHMIGSLRVTRDLHQARTQAQQQALFRAAMIAHARECVIAMDALGHVVEFNPAAEAVLGFTREEAVGRNVVDLLSPADDRDLFQAAVCDPHGSERPVDLRVRRRDGSVLVFETSVVRLEPADFGHRIAFMSDITEQRRAAMEAQRAFELLEQTHRSRSSFIAVVSHEIRTPLTTITSALDLLADSPLGEDDRTVVQAARAASNSLLELVAAMLDFSRLDAGAFLLNRAGLNLATLLDSLCEQFQPHARRKGLVLEVEADPSLPQEVRADAVRVRQILTNLLGNAIKFTDRGSVRLGATVVSRDEKGVGVRFSVTDTGVGIPEAFREHIFDSFTQADSSLTRLRGGVGLGLAISSKLAEVMGGSLRLRDSSAAGTVFDLELPFEVIAGYRLDWIASAGGRETGIAPASPTRIDVGGGDVSILIVEDNYLNQALLRRQLEQAGFSVVSVTGGEQALDKLRKGRFAAVLTDLEMPHVDGLEMTRRHRAFEQAAGREPVPIIALTGHSGRDFRSMALAAGMNAFITKPYRANELIARLRQVLGT